METLSFEQMENVQGGVACSQEMNQAIAVIGLVSGVASFIPVVGWAILDRQQLACQLQEQFVHISK